MRISWSNSMIVSFRGSSDLIRDRFSTTHDLITIAASPAIARRLAGVAPGNSCGNGGLQRWKKTARRAKHGSFCLHDTIPDTMSAAEVSHDA